MMSFKNSMRCKFYEMFKMKFGDIPKFTRTPAWHTDMPLDHFKIRFEEFIDKYHLQLNPDFQRGHVWTKAQKIAYIEYLLRGGKSGKDFYFNHPGWMKNFKGEFVCVDGLQRITACLAFLNNEIPAFGYLLEEYDDNIRMADVMLSIWVNDLKDKKDVLEWYLEMNSGGTPHSQEEFEKIKKMIKELDNGTIR